MLTPEAIRKYLLERLWGLTPIARADDFIIKPLQAIDVITFLMTKQKAKAKANTMNALPFAAMHRRVPPVGGAAMMTRGCAQGKEGR